jgi:hypothetical protein
MVWYGMVWYGMVWYGMVWYGGYINMCLSTAACNLPNTFVAPDCFRMRSERARERDSGSLPNRCRNVTIHVTKPPSVGKYQPRAPYCIVFGNRAGRALAISISLSISPCPSLLYLGTCCSDGANTDTDNTGADSDHDGPVEHGRGRAQIRIDWILAFLQPGDITKLCMTVSRAVVWG